ncbi:unnamed protein product [Acidithrix sp. C25]|nr:unnamed protein product [Acidithrix sp. C25]
MMFYTSLLHVPLFSTIGSRYCGRIVHGYILWNKWNALTFGYEGLSAAQRRIQEL